MVFAHWLSQHLCAAHQRALLAHTFARWRSAWSPTSTAAAIQSDQLQRASMRWLARALTAVHHVLDDRTRAGPLALLWIRQPTIEHNFLSATRCCSHVGRQWTALQPPVPTPVAYPGQQHPPSRGVAWGPPGQHNPPSCPRHGPRRPVAPVGYALRRGIQRVCVLLFVFLTSPGSIKPEGTEENGYAKANWEALASVAPPRTYERGATISEWAVSGKHRRAGSGPCQFPVAHTPPPSADADTINDSAPPH